MGLVRRLVADGSAREIRLLNRLSLAEVGESVGASPTTIWRWEKGERMPHGDAAMRYADLLGQLALSKTGVAK